MVHLEISAKDQTNISDFHGQLFDWQATNDNPMNYRLAITKDGELGIDRGVYQQQDAQDAPGIRIYAQVDDPAAYLAKAQELAGTLVQPAIEIPGMGIMVSMFQDPEGTGSE